MKKSRNPWIEHVKKYQRKHKCTYKKAMKKSKKTYKPINHGTRAYKPSSRTRVKGKGLFKRIIKTGKKWFNKGGKIVMKAIDHSQAFIRNKLNRNPLSTKQYPGERHAVELQGKYAGSSYNFMGPGTHIKQRYGIQGINAADNAAKTHDIAYERIAHLISKGVNHEQIKALVRRADNRFLAAIKPYTAKREILIAYLAIKNKNHLEDLNKLPFTKFITNIE